MNIPFSREDLIYVTMAVENSIAIEEDALSWNESQGRWDDAEQKKKLLKHYRDILEKLEAVNTKLQED